MTKSSNTWRFSKTLPFEVGTNQFSVKAMDDVGRTLAQQAVTYVRSADTAETLEYDVNGNLVKVYPPGVESGAFGLVVTRSVVTETVQRFWWDGLTMIQKDLASTSALGTEAPTRWVLHGQGEREIKTTWQETTPGNGSWVQEVKTYIYSRDHLGSVTGLLDISSGSAVPVLRLSYDPWGNATGRDANGAAVTAKSTPGGVGFTGHQYHAATGLLLAPFRVYDSVAGRWISEDPIGEAGGLNLYGYVGNAVMRGMDPLGLEEGHSIRDFFSSAYDVLTSGHAFDNYGDEVTRTAIGAGKGVLSSVTLGLSQKISAFKVNPCDEFESAGGVIGELAGTAVTLATGAGGLAKLAGGADRVLLGSVQRGIYRFTGQSGSKYIGQSKNLTGRLFTNSKSHLKTGKLPAGNRVTTWQVRGNQIARERAEQQMINKYGLENLENIVNPLGGRPWLYHSVPTVGESALAGAIVGEALGMYDYANSTNCN